MARDSVGGGGIGLFETRQATYERARRALEEDRIDDALAAYTRLRRSNPSDELAEAALLDLGYAALRRGDFPAALGRAQEFLQFHPASARVPYARVLRASATYGLVRAEARPDEAVVLTAIADLEEVGAAFPDVAPPELVEEMMAELRGRG